MRPVIFQTLPFSIPLTDLGAGRNGNTPDATELRHPCARSGYRSTPAAKFHMRLTEHVWFQASSSHAPDMSSQPDTLFRRVEIARPLRKTYGPTTTLREWKVWTWPRFANATLSSAFERL
jgi:hypothetical protein